MGAGKMDWPAGDGLPGPRPRTKTFGHAGPRAAVDTGLTLPTPLDSRFRWNDEMSGGSPRIGVRDMLS